MVWSRKLSVLLSVLCFTLIQLPVSSAWAEDDHPRQFDSATSGAIDKIVQDRMAAGPVPGMAVGVWIPGRGTFVRAYGTSNIATGARFLVRDHVRIASITKTFTATEILRLVDRKRLTLDDHLDKYVGGVPYGDQITVRELLNMTSGVFDYTSDAAFAAAFDKDPLMAFSPKDALAIINKPGNHPAFLPGAPNMWQYSDTNYVLLQLIVESITHRPLHDVIEDDLISRADLEHTSYPTTPRIPRPFSHGYLSTTSGLRDVTALNPAAGGGAGAMIATLDDLSVWARVVATGTLLRPETQRARLQFVDTHLPGPVKTSYGLGILNFQGFLGHNGAIYGFNTEMFYLPQTRATIVVVSNESNNVDGQATIAFYLIAKLLYPGLFSR